MPEQEFLIKNLEEKIENEKKILLEIKNRLEIFYDISTLLTLGPSLEEILKEMFEKIGKKLKVTTFCIWLLDEKKENFIIAAHYLFSDIIMEIYKKTGQRSTEGVSGVVFRTKKPYLMKDVYADPRVPQRYLQAVKESGGTIRSVFSLPLMIRGEVIGVFANYFAQPRGKIPRAEFIIFSTIANQLASFIQNSKIYKDLQARIEQLEKINRLTVGRELRMRELKNEIKKLEEALQKCQKVTA